MYQAMGYSSEKHTKKNPHPLPSGAHVLVGATDAKQAKYVKYIVC